jgi:hypothetical protein
LVFAGSDFIFFRLLLRSIIILIRDYSVPSFRPNIAHSSLVFICFKFNCFNNLHCSFGLFVPSVLSHRRTPDSSCYRGLYNRRFCSPELLYLRLGLKVLFAAIFTFLCQPLHPSPPSSLLIVSLFPSSSLQRLVLFLASASSSTRRPAAQPRFRVKFVATHPVLLLSSSARPLPARNLYRRSFVVNLYAIFFYF